MHSSSGYVSQARTPQTVGTYDDVVSIESSSEQASTRDSALEQVVQTLRTADPNGERAAKVLRDTYDQLYDGQRTGRYRWDQLFKTEKTHYGTLIEINLRREFDDVVEDGELLDFKVAGHEIDCKYSQKYGGWMLPPECFDQLLLVCTANDQDGQWSLGVVRATESHRRTSSNRDAKAGLNSNGRDAIRWLERNAPLPPNVLLQMDPKVLARIFSYQSGQRRVNELFRSAQGLRINRSAVATVAQQDDYMKRVRSNGGARSALAWEGILIAGGDYESHRKVAEMFDVAVPQPGEFVSFTVVPAAADDPRRVVLDGTDWRLAEPGEFGSNFAPTLPSTKRINE